MHYHGIDLLKIISMIFIMALHVMGQGGILRSAEGINYYIVWLLEILCYCSVNCYAIISGFLGYGKQRRLSRYIVLWLQVVFFGIFIWGIAAVVKPELVGINDVVKLILPVTFDQYWYFTAYSVLFLIMPMLNIFVDKLTEKEGRKVLLSCFLVFSCYGVLNYRYSDSLHLVKGNSAIWLAVLYVVGALFKKFQWTFQTKKVLGVLVICWLGGWFWRVKLSNMIGHGVENLVLNYVSPVMFVMAICFFVLFLNIGKESKMIKAISASTFGAYLFQ